MSDMITGVLVLQRMPSHGPGVYGLWFEYTRNDGIKGYSYIPVKEAHVAADPSVKVPLWNIVRKNPWLECTPSVRILGPTNDSPDHFHNQGHWSNHYVEMAADYGAEPEAREVCQEINKLGTKEERDTLILEYRSKEILL